MRIYKTCPCHRRQYKADISVGRPLLGVPNYQINRRGFHSVAHCTDHATLVPIQSVVKCVERSGANRPSSFEDRLSTSWSYFLIWANQYRSCAIKTMAKNKSDKWKGENQCVELHSSIHAISHSLGSIILPGWILVGCHEKVVRRTFLADCLRRRSFGSISRGVQGE